MGWHNDTLISININITDFWCVFDDIVYLFQIHVCFCSNSILLRALLKKNIEHVCHKDKFHTECFDQLIVFISSEFEFLDVSTSCKLKYGL